MLGALFFAQTGQSHPLQSEGVVRAFALVVYGIYFVGCWSVRGQTLAMQTWRIRVVAADGALLSQARALARYVACCIAWFAPATLARHRPAPASLAEPGRGGRRDRRLRPARPGRPGRQFWHDIAWRHAAGRHPRRAGGALEPQTASSLTSPVRIRTTLSIEVTKILPSPILPVLARLDDRLDAALGVAVLDHDLDLHLGQEVDHVLGAAIELGVALLPAEALDLGDGQAETPISASASRTSSSLNGLTMAVICFMARAPDASDRGRV